MATWSDVSRAVAALPETEPGTSYGNRAWRIRKKLLVWERPLRRADLDALGADAPTGDILGLPTAGVADRDELLAAAPEVFFTTPHFDNYSAVLARLETLPVDVLNELVRDAWLRSAPKGLVRAYLGPEPEGP